jgi:4-hydroxy-tetrahydrodipicolinate synthase
MNEVLEKFRGTGVAIVTPFNDDFSIDYNAIKKLVEYVIDGGVDYIVVQGTTGESSTLTQDEKIKSRRAFIDANKERVPLVVGIGSNDTGSLINYIKSSDLKGFSAVLSVTPYYNKPTQEGLFKHYSLLAQSSSLPLILYNVPSRTSCNLEPETVIRLAQNNKNIIGIKEAKGDLQQMDFLIKNRPSNFLIISGDDETAPSSIINGADGVISVAAGCIPKLYNKIIDSALNHNKFETLELLSSIKPFLKNLFIEGNPAGLKSALSIQKLCKNKLRLPLLPVSTNLHEKIEKFIIKNS